MLYDRPFSLQQRVLEDDPDRPMSAMAFDYRGSDVSMAGLGREASQDLSMVDAGPSTAPLQGGNMTFFREN